MKNYITTLFAAAGFAMSIVLAVTGCASTAPAPEPAQSGLQEEAGQENSVQEAEGKETAVQENTGQETAGEEITAKVEVQDDVFDFEENGLMPFHIRTTWKYIGGLREKHVRMAAEILKQKREAMGS